MKSLSLFKKLTVALLVIALFASVFTGCAHNNGDASSKVSPDWYSEKMSRTMPINSENDMDYLYHSDKSQSFSLGFAVGYTLPEILERSTIVVRGKVLGFDYLTIKDKYTSYVATNYYVEIEDTLRGEPLEDNGLITVRTEGGENDDQIVMNKNILLTVGQEYLFFLFRYTHGYGSFVENDNSYLVVGGCIGAFTAGDETVEREDGTSVPKFFIPYTPTSVCSDPIEYLPFLDEIAEYNETNPVDPEYHDKQFRANMEANLAEGMITQKEFDEFLSTMDTYAEILYYTEPKP